MKRKVILRCIIGAPIGLALSMIITIIISLTVNDGFYYAVVPELIKDCGNEMNAVMLQTLFSFLYGAAWAGASVIWEKDDWSLLKQSVLHLMICSLATLPIAYICRWMPHNGMGLLLYFGSFFAIYAIIWISQYIGMKKRIQQMNEKISRK